MAALLPHLSLTVSESLSLTVEASLPGQQMEGYQAVSQTQLITSWAKEADMEGGENLPDMEEGDDKQPIQPT